MKYQKMLILFYLSVLVSIVFTQPIDGEVQANDDVQARILTYDDKDDGKGNHEFSFETSNGISRNEKWYLKNAGTPDEHIAVEGQYSYIDPDGKRITIVYSADENGYFAQPEEPPPPIDHLVQQTPAVAQVDSRVLATLLGG